MNTTAKLSTFVVFILVGARVFSLTFYGVNGHVWVEHLLTALPGGQLGFLIVVNILIFVLAFFLDFFELSFIIIPLIGPVADKLGVDLIWFGVLLARQHADVVHASAVRLRALLPAQRRARPRNTSTGITGRKTAPVTTGQIYWGAVPFVLIQVLMVGLIIAFPNIVSGGLATKEKIDIRNIRIEVPPKKRRRAADARAGSTPSRTMRRRRWSARWAAAQTAPDRQRPTRRRETRSSVRATARISAPRPPAKENGAPATRSPGAPCASRIGTAVRRGYFFFVATSAARRS